MNLLCRKLLRLFLTFGVCAVHPVVPGVADSPCVPLNSDIPIRSTLASAGFFANLRGSDDSLRVKMDSLLSEARSVAREVSKSGEGCRSGCARKTVAVIFRSIPNAALAEYDEASVCGKLLDATRREPIRYDNRRFASDDDAKNWYRELTQGDGADGEDLYKRCPGKCSPEYSSIAYRDGSELVVSVKAICGHARDRDDDQYRLSAAVRWICP